MSSRRKRIALFAFGALMYAALLWYIVFPWVDRTFVSRPAV